ncbi:hypothetical protein ACNKHL_20285 [Shigella flexneri]
MATAAFDFWRRRGAGAVERGVAGGMLGADEFTWQAAVVGGMALRCLQLQWRCN